MVLEIHRQTILGMSNFRVESEQIDAFVENIVTDIDHLNHFT